MGYGVAVLWLDVEMSNKVLSKLEPQESSRMATTRPYYYTDHAGAKQGSAHPPHSMPTRRTSTGIFIPHQQKAFVPLTILIKKAVKLKEKGFSNSKLWTYFSMFNSRLVSGRFHSYNCC